MVYKKFVKKNFNKKKKKVTKAVRTYVKKTIEKMEEDKFKLIDTQTTTPLAVGSAILLNGLSQGTSITTRLGNKVRMVGLQLRIRMLPTGGIPTVNSWLRCMLVLDKQTNGVALTPANLFASGAATFSPFSQYDPNVVPSRYTILYDRTYRLDIQGGGNDVGRELYIKVNKPSWKKHPVVVQYNNGNAGTVADISKHSLYLVYFSEQAITGLIAVVWTSLMFYDDA